MGLGREKMGGAEWACSTPLYLFLFSVCAVLGAIHALWTGVARHFNDNRMNACMEKQSKGSDEWYYVTYFYLAAIYLMYNFLTLTLTIKRTWISDTSNWSIENKIPMKLYDYPTTIYCCINRWLFVRKIQPREKRKEKSQWMFLRFSELKTKTWAWITLAGK